jgi:hypothetical protein
MKKPEIQGTSSGCLLRVALLDKAGQWKGIWSLPFLGTCSTEYYDPISLSISVATTCNGARLSSRFEWTSCDKSFGSSDLVLDIQKLGVT